MRDRINRLLRSPGLWVGLGGNGRIRYEQQFTLDHLVTNTLAVYRSVPAGG